MRRGANRGGQLMDQLQRNQTPDPPDRQLSEEAAEWFLRMSASEADGDDIYSSAIERNAAFYDWYTRSPQHLKAFLDLCEVDLRSLSLDPQHRIDIEAVLARPTSDVIPLPGAAPTQRQRRVRLLPVSIAAALGALVTMAA